MNARSTSRWGLVDPWTGEGIYHALVSGRLAGETLAARAGLAGESTRRDYSAWICRGLSPWLLGSEVLRRGASTPLLEISARVLGRAGVAELLERLYGGRARR